MKTKNHNLNGWISTNDCLPDDDTFVMAYDGNTMMLMAIKRLHGMKTWMPCGPGYSFIRTEMLSGERGYITVNDGILYWLPVPNPPSIGDKEVKK